LLLRRLHVEERFAIAITGRPEKVNIHVFKQQWVSGLVLLLRGLRHDQTVVNVDVGQNRVLGPGQQDDPVPLLMLLN